MTGQGDDRPYRYEASHFEADKAGDGALAALWEMRVQAESKFDWLLNHDELRPFDDRVSKGLRLLEDLIEWQPLSKNEVTELMERISAYLHSPDNERALSAFSITDYLYDLVDTRSAYGVEIRGRSYQGLIDELERIQLLDRADNAASRAESTVERIEQLERAARSATGEVSSYALGQHYDTHAENEESAADRYRWGAILTTGLAFAASAFLPYGKAFDWVDAAHRLTIVVPSLVLAGYLARESSQHRYVARALRSSQIKVQTLWGFSEGFPDDTIRSAFLDRIGSAVFAERSPQPGDRADGAVDATEGLLQSVVDLLRAAGLPRAQ